MRLEAFAICALRVPPEEELIVVEKEQSSVRKEPRRR
jgi:hypothetical protein